MRLDWSNIGKGLESIAQVKRERDYRKAVAEEEAKYRAPEAVETPRYFDTEGVEITPVEGADLSQYLTSPGDVTTQYRTPSGGLYRDMASAEAATPQAPSMRQQLLTKAGLAEKYGLDTKSKELMESASKLGYLDYYDELATEKRTERQKKVKAEDAFNAILRAADSQDLQPYERMQYIIDKSSSYGQDVASLASGFLSNQNMATEALAVARLADLKAAHQKGLNQFLKRFGEIEGEGIEYTLKPVEVGGKEQLQLMANGEPTDQIFTDREHANRTIKTMMSSDNIMAFADGQLEWQRKQAETERSLIQKEIETELEILKYAQRRVADIRSEEGNLRDRKTAIAAAEKDAQAALQNINNLRERLRATLGGPAKDLSDEDIALYADASPEQAALMEQADPRLKLRPNVQAMRKRRQEAMAMAGQLQGLGAPASDVPTGLFNPNAPAPTAPGTGAPVFAPPGMKNGGLVRRFANGGDVGMNMDDRDIQMASRAADRRNAAESRQKEATKDRVEKLTAAGEAFSSSVVPRGVADDANLSYMPLTDSGALDNLRKAMVQAPDLSRYMNRGGMYRSYARGGLAARDYRRGGDVDGPGTPTSDSIPAYLSDGEFVINERAMRIPGVAEMAEAANNAGLKLRDGKAKKKNSKAKA